MNEISHLVYIKLTMIPRPRIFLPDFETCNDKRNTNTEN